MTMREALDWRRCIGFPKYEVSNCGDVRSFARSKSERNLRLRGFIDEDGYLRYSMSDVNGVKCARHAHRLVAEAFIGQAPSADYQVAHNNGSRVDNRWENLRWATVTENQRDRFTHQTSSAGTNNGRATISEDDVHYIRREYRLIKYSRGRRHVGELDEKFGLCRATIIRIAKGESWAHVPFTPADRP